MDGVACARAILERHPGVHPCILLVTAFGRDDALRAAAGVALAGVLQKPVTPSALHDALLQAWRMTSPRALPRTVRPAQAAQPLAGARVLLVEDHPLNQQLAGELLRRAGMDVVVASDGAEALQRLEEAGPFDGVLMDCQMPVMDGYTATRRLREDPRWTRLPVIAMTASALADDRARAFAAGMNAHIAKPLDVEAMMATMAQWIRPRAPRPVGEDTGPTTTWRPHGIPGAIDTDDGLSRCMGKADLYRRLLRGFRESELDFAADMQEAVAQGRFEHARRRAHDLKGLAGTIGARELQRAAQSLHAALLADGNVAASPQLDLVNAELAVVLQEIDELVPLA